MKKILLVALIMISVANAKVVSKDPITIDGVHWTSYTCTGACTIHISYATQYAFETHDKSIFLARRDDTIHASAGTKVWLKANAFNKTRSFVVNIAEEE